MSTIPRPVKLVEQDTIDYVATARRSLEITSTGKLVALWLKVTLNITTTGGAVIGRDFGGILTDLRLTQKGIPLQDWVHGQDAYNFAVALRGVSPRLDTLPTGAAAAADYVFYVPLIGDMGINKLAGTGWNLNGIDPILLSFKWGVAADMYSTTTGVTINSGQAEVEAQVEDVLAGDEITPIQHTYEVGNYDAAGSDDKQYRITAEGIIYLVSEVIDPGETAAEKDDIDDIILRVGSSEVIRGKGETLKEIFEGFTAADVPAGVFPIDVAARFTAEGYDGTVVPVTVIVQHRPTAAQNTRLYNWRVQTPVQV